MSSDEERMQAVSIMFLMASTLPPFCPSASLANVELHLRLTSLKYLEQQLDLTSVLQRAVSITLLSLTHHIIPSQELKECVNTTTSPKRRRQVKDFLERLARNTEWAMKQRESMVFDVHNLSQCSQL